MAQIVGQVELQVVPNDSTFNRDLQRIIDKAPKLASQNLTPSLNTAAFEAAAKNLTQTASTASDQATQALSGITPNLNTAAFQAQANQVAEIADEAASKASLSFGRIAVGVGVGAAALYGLKAASEAVIGSLSKLYDNLLKAKAGFESILGEQEGNKLLTDITEFARVTPFATEQLVQYSQQLLGVGRSADSIIPTLRSVGDLVASKGGDTQTISRVLFTLTQIQSVGRLIGQDTLQLQSALIPITQLLAKNLGKTQQEVKALQAAGKITSDQVFSTLEKAGIDVAGAMEGATRNIGGAKEALNDTVKILLQKSPALIAINQDIVDAIKNLTTFLGSDRVSSVVSDLSSGLADLYESVQPLFGTLSEVSGDLIVTTLEAVVPLLQLLSQVLNGIPIPALTALSAFLVFNKFQTFVTGFGAVTKVLTNFGGVIGGVASGLTSSANALKTQGSVSTAAQASQAALVRTYQQTATAATSATIQTDAYTQALKRQQAAAVAAGAGSFGAPTGPRIDPATGRPVGQSRLGRLASGFTSGSGKLGAAAGVAGVAGVIGLSQRENVDGTAGNILGVASTAATGAALGFSIGGPIGAAIGTAAGAGFGIFQEFGRRAREAAEKDAEKWGAIGKKAAEAFSKDFAENYDVSATGSATQTERTVKQNQDTADIILLNAAAKTGRLGPNTIAAAKRLGVELELDKEEFVTFGPKLQDFIDLDPDALTNAPVVRTDDAQFGQKNVFTVTTTDKENFATQLKDFDPILDEYLAERKQKTDVVAGLLGNPLSAEFFKQFNGTSNLGLDATAAEIEEANNIVIGGTFDRLQKFGIGLEEAIKKGESLSFYFSEILADIQGSVDASFKFNASLDESKAIIESINAERIKEANSRIAALQAEEDFGKRIKALTKDAKPIEVASIAKDALSNAGAQAAFEGAEKGLSNEEIATRQQVLFATSIQDVQEQTGLSDEKLKAYLKTAGLYDDYLSAVTDKNEALATIEERLATLRALAEADTGRSAGRIAAEITQLEAKRDALNGIVTAETLVDQARERRNAAALGEVKATEALQGVFGQLAVGAVDGGGVTTGQFGDAAQQAFDRANATGDTTAEDNQLFVDSVENIQLALGLTDDVLLEYLENVGLLDAYNKAVAESSVGVAESVDQVATRFGLTNEQVRELLGLLPLIPGDVPIYLSVDATAAFAELAAVDAEIARLQTAAADPNASGQERAAANRALTNAEGRKKAAEDRLTAAGADVNAGVGARQAFLDEQARIAKEKADKEAADRAKEFADALEKAAREAEAWQNKVDSAANTISSAMENAARAVEDASVAWQQSIKERVQYESAVSVGRLTRNAQGQTKDLKELDAGLSNLRGRGVSQEVLDSLGIDNVDDLKQVRKLVKANDSDLAALTQAVGQRDEASLAIAKNEEDKRTRENITTAVIAAAVTLGFDVSKDQAASISNQFTITPGTDYDTLTDQILSYLSSGKIAR